MELPSKDSKIGKLMVEKMMELEEEQTYSRPLDEKEFDLKGVTFRNYRLIFTSLTKRTF